MKRRDSLNDQFLSWLAVVRIVEKADNPQQSECDKSLPRPRGSRKVLLVSVSKFGEKKLAVVPLNQARVTILLAVTR
jgi:hypothetical protein